MIKYLFKNKIEKSKPNSLNENLDPTFLKSNELDNLRSYIEEAENHYKDQISELKLKIKNVFKENVSLREEMREWICEACNNVFYGGNSLALRQITCPLCNKGSCIPKKLYKIKELELKIEELTQQNNILEIKRSA